MKKFNLDILKPKSKKIVLPQSGVSVTVTLPRVKDSYNKEKLSNYDNYIDVDFSKLSIVDSEYILMTIYSEQTDVLWTHYAECAECGVEVVSTYNTDDAHISTIPDNKIKVFDDLDIFLKYPTNEDISNYYAENDTQTIDVLYNIVESVFYNDEEVLVDDIKAFVDNLPNSVVGKVAVFLNNQATVLFDVNVACECGNKSTETITFAEHLS